MAQFSKDNNHLDTFCHQWDVPNTDDNESAVSSLGVGKLSLEYAQILTMHRACDKYSHARCICLYITNSDGIEM